MITYDVEAVIYNGEIFCVACLPKGVDLNIDEAKLIFTDSKRDRLPICYICGCEHECVALLEC